MNRQIYFLEKNEKTQIFATCYTAPKKSISSSSEPCVFLCIASRGAENRDHGTFQYYHARHHFISTGKKNTLVYSHLCSAKIYYFPLSQEMSQTCKLKKREQKSKDNGNSTQFSNCVTCCHWQQPVRRTHEHLKKGKTNGEKKNIYGKLKRLLEWRLCQASHTGGNDWKSPVGNFVTFTPKLLPLGVRIIKIKNTRMTGSRTWALLCSNPCKKQQKSLSRSSGRLRQER